jgi:CheY-like chemotaxis protein
MDRFPESAEFSRQAILIADDNDDDAFLMENLFRKLRIPNPLHRVVDGEEAIAYFEGAGEYADRYRFPLPVIVLLDLNMPRRNGFEVLSWLRSHPSFQSVTAHILSASMRQVDVDKAMALGANAYIVKPSLLEELMELFAAWYCVACHSGFGTLTFGERHRRTNGGSPGPTRRDQ